MTEPLRALEKTSRVMTSNSNEGATCLGNWVAQLAFDRD